MTTALQQKIRDFLDQEDLSVAALERRAGLKTNVIRNILAGQSKKPTGVTLTGIAKAMKCSLGELLGERGGTEEMLGLTLEKPDLYKNIFDRAFSIAQKNNLKITTKDLFLMLDEMYLYALKKTPPHLDDDFIEWFVGRMLRTPK